MNETFNMFKIPKYERPRERLDKLGAQSLSLQELLTIILGQGNKKESVHEITKQIIVNYGDVQNLSAASVNDLCKVKGVGYAKAAQLKASIELGKRFYAQKIKEDSKYVLTSAQAFELANYFLKDKKKEHLLLFCLDTHGKLIKDPEILSIGTLDASLVHPREIFNSAIQQNASRIMLAHNHPSGFSDPSPQDIEVTKQIFKAGLIMGIQLIDHIIVGSNSFQSIHEIKPEIFRLSQYDLA
jgi:DNA repair protein RadC